ncbi:MAG: cytochrome c [Pseudomonadota bacterium]
MKNSILAFFSFAFLISIASAQDRSDSRWYSPKLVQTGKRVFDQNCAACHGSQGQGLADDWRKPLADGSYPPPPLNGTAHAWHHPISQLLRTINDGGVPLGGKMPGFRQLLTKEEKVAVIAYFQNWWSDAIYQEWLSIGGLEY